MPRLNARPINAAKIIADATKDAQDAGEIDQREAERWLSISAAIQRQYVRRRHQKVEAAE